MTTTEYLALRKTLTQGCISERVCFVATMPAKQLKSFIEYLVLPSIDPLACETWRILAHVASQRIGDLLAEIDGPTPCADINNSDCACTLCEARREAVASGLNECPRCGFMWQDMNQLEQRQAAVVTA